MTYRISGVEGLSMRMLGAVVGFDTGLASALEVVDGWPRYDPTRPPARIEERKRLAQERKEEKP